MPRANDKREPIRDPQLAQQRLDPWMQRLARPVASRGCAFAQDNTEAPRRAGDRGGGAGRPAAYDNDVGIDLSVAHGPSSWRNRTVPPSV